MERTMSVEISPVIEARTLIDTAETNFNTIMRHVKDITHEESLIQPSFNSNCMNWLLGHIHQSRDKMLRLVDAATVCSPEQAARYDRGSEPIKSGEDAARFEAMLADFQTAHERLI